MDNDSVQLYDNQPIRTVWDEENEEGYFQSLFGLLYMDNIVIRGFMSLF